MSAAQESAAQVLAAQVSAAQVSAQGGRRDGFQEVLE